VVAHFDRCLVLVYAFPAANLQDCVPAGMSLDAWEGLGFAAAAFVQTRSLRPEVMPSWCGRDFFLAGYRVFVKHRTREGRTLRGLRILRSDSDRRAMVWGGNLLTHYNYRLCRAEVSERGGSVGVRVRSADGRADVDVEARVEGDGDVLPRGSPFPDARSARRFEGPMPYTFDYEARTHSVIRIRGARTTWDPRLVDVEVREMGVIEREMLAGRGAMLAAAFHVRNVDYRWERGVVERLEGAAA
jgi:hypothetical protein